MALIRRREDTGLLQLERPEYYVQTGSMFENPHGVPPDEIVRMVVEYPPEVAAQVVFGKYVESSGLVFTSELIEMLFDRSMPIIRGSSWMDKQAAAHAREMWLRAGYRVNNRFFTGVDFARKTDYTVIFTIDTLRMPARVVYYRRLNRVSWDDIFAEVGRAVHLFGANVLADSTGMGGDVVMNSLEGRLYCATHHAAVLNDSRCVYPDGRSKDCKKEHYLSLACCDGYEFGGGTGRQKTNLLDHLRGVLAVGKRNNPEDFGWLRCPPIPQLEEELTFYAWDDKGLETDALMALALAAMHGLEDPVRDAVVGSPFGR